jgi:hypothetical protein
LFCLGSTDAAWVDRMISAAQGCVISVANTTHADSGGDVD